MSVWVVVGVFFKMDQCVETDKRNGRGVRSVRRRGEGMPEGGVSALHAMAASGHNCDDGGHRRRGARGQVPSPAAAVLARRASRAAMPEHMKVSAADDSSDEEWKDL